jgi:hypothetical protein
MLTDENNLTLKLMIRVKEPESKSIIIHIYILTIVTAPDLS